MKASTIAAAEDMPDTDVFRLQKSDLNPFLFADVGPESNGMSLSVVSMLGRLGGDPWEDAGRLAGQTREAATRELAEIIAGTLSSGGSSTEIMAIATRLAALLPNAASRRASSRPVNSGTPRQPGVRWTMPFVTWCAVALVVVILISRFLGYF